MKITNRDIVFLFLEKMTTVVYFIFLRMKFCSKWQRSFRKLNLVHFLRRWFFFFFKNEALFKMTKVFSKMKIGSFLRRWFFLFFMNEVLFKMKKFFLFFFFHMKFLTFFLEMVASTLPLLPFGEVTYGLMVATVKCKLNLVFHVCLGVRGQLCQFPIGQRLWC